MSDNGKNDSGIGMHNENLRKFPADELLKYRGLVVAWSLDGTKILASGKDIDAAMEQLTAVGFDPHKVVWSQMDPPDIDGII